MSVSQLQRKPAIATTEQKDSDIRSATDPTALFDIAEGMHAIEALTAAIGWLHLCEWLDKKSTTESATEEEICRALELAPRPGRVLLTLLASFGVVSRDNQGVYSLTQLAKEHLLPDSRWSLVPCFDALKDRPTCLEMLSVLRTGKPIGAPPQDDSAASPWAEGMDNEGFAEYFLNAIDSRNAYLADVMAEQLDLSRYSALLDIGGGSGIYSCALVRRNPGQQATVLEKAPVDAVARRAIERRGLSSRVSVVSGDMLGQPLPNGHDVHLYSNVIHDWEENVIERLLASSYSALPQGGQVVIHDAFLDETQSAPRAVAEYSVLLMSFTSGRCYSVEEIRSLLEKAGFVQIIHRPTAVHRSLITALKPQEDKDKNGTLSAKQTIRGTTGK